MFCPSRPDLCLDYCLCPSLFSFFVWCVCRRRFSVFYLSFRRWGNANPPGVCVSPCVSWTRPLTSTRTSRTTSTPRSPPRLCFFLLPTTSLVVPVVVGLGLFWVCWASFFFLGGPGALFECMHELDRERGDLSDGAPVNDYNHCFGVECEAVSWTVRPEPLVLPHLLPQAPKVGAGRGGGGAGRTVTQMLLFCWFNGLCCHANAGSLSLLGRGKSFFFAFFVFFVFGSASFPFFLFFFRVAVRNEFSGANF